MNGRQEMRDTATRLRSKYPHVFRHHEPTPTLDVARIEQARQRTTGRLPDPQLTLDLTPQRKDR